jgi:hypothetical protein
MLFMRECQLMLSRIQTKFSNGLVPEGAAIEIVHPGMFAKLFVDSYLWKDILPERECRRSPHSCVTLGRFGVGQPAYEFSLDNLLPIYAFHQSKYAPILAPNRAKIINSLPLYGRFFNILPLYGFNSPTKKQDFSLVLAKILPVYALHVCQFMLLVP